MIQKKLQFPRNESRFFYGYNIVILAFFIMVLTYGVRTSFGVFFKPVEAELGWSRALISGAVTLSMIVHGLWGINMGRINDKTGSRWIITFCSFFIGLGTILVSFTNYAWQLYLFHGLILGVGMGGVFVSIMSTVTRWFVRKRGLMTGIVLGGIGIGTVTFAPLSNWLISLYGWRQSNLIIGVAVIVAGIAMAQFLRRDPGQMRLLPYGQIENSKTESSPISEGLSLKEAAGTWQFWMTAVVFALIGYCTFTITIHIVPHVTDIGIDAATAAGILAVTGGVQGLGGIIFGTVADRIGNRNVIIVSMILAAASLFWLISLTSAVLLYLFAFIYALGIGGSTAMESTITADLFGIRSHGAILGVISFGFTVGAAIGPFVTGYLFDLAGNYRTAFLVCAMIGAMSVVLTAFIRPVKQRKS